MEYGERKGWGLLLVGRAGPCRTCMAAQGCPITVVTLSTPGLVRWWVYTGGRQGLGIVTLPGRWGLGWRSALAAVAWVVGRNGAMLVVQWALRLYAVRVCCTARQAHSGATVSCTVLLARAGPHVCTVCGYKDRTVRHRSKLSRASCVPV